MCLVSSITDAQSWLLMVRLMRVLVIAGPDKKLKLSLNYPASVGRNMDEIVRCVDALQLSAKYSVATPANCELATDTRCLLDLQDVLTMCARLCEALSDTCKEGSSWLQERPVPASDTSINHYASMRCMRR